MKSTRIIIPTILLASSIAQACPMCRDSTVTGDPAATAGFNGSIGWMLGGLLVVILMLLWKIVQSVRQGTAA